MKTLFIFFSLLSSTASATSWSEHYTYFVRFHFDAFAFGKQVSSVYAHAGVLRQKSSCQDPQRTRFWDDVKHIKMVRKNNHFFAKTLFRESTGECQPLVLGPIVQYWVYFTDGTSMQTTGTLVPAKVGHVGTYDDYKRFQSGMSDDFLQCEDASSTYATGFNYGYAS